MRLTTLVTSLAVLSIGGGCAATAPSGELRTFLVAYSHLPQAGDIMAIMAAGGRDPVAIAAVKMLRVRSPQTAALATAAFIALPGVDSAFYLDAEADPIVQIFLTTVDSVTSADLAFVASHQTGEMLTTLGPTTIIAGVRVLSIESIAANPRFIAVSVTPVAGYLQSTAEGRGVTSPAVP